MDPNDFGSDGDDDASAMAAAMGFSSFGGHDRPAKKRRYHAGADAVVAGQPSRPAAMPAGTGANTQPLQPRASRRAPAENADEINLDADEGFEVGDGDGTAIPTQPLDQDAQAAPWPSAQGHDFGAGGHGGGLNRGRGGLQHRFGRGGVAHNSRAGTGRPQWWLDYYDPSSNENPWERLEQAQSITAKGFWLTRSGKTTAVATESA